MPACFKQAFAAIALSIVGLSANASLIITNASNGQTISPLGPGSDTTTYGEIFTAPASPNDQLDAFTLYIEGTDRSLYAGVAQWDGTGAGAALFTSANFSGSYASMTPVTVNTGGVNLVAGQQYVVYFSAAGIVGDTGTDIMEEGTGSAYNGGFAWDNASGGSPNNLNWDGRCTGTPAQCSAHGNFAYVLDFNTTPAGHVPEPAPLALIGIGLAAAGLVYRKRMN